MATYQEMSGIVFLGPDEIIPPPFPRHQQNNDYFTHEILKKVSQITDHVLLLMIDYSVNVTCWSWIGYKYWNFGTIDRFVYCCYFC